MAVCSAWPKFDLHTPEYLDELGIDWRLILQYMESSWKWNLNTQNLINCSVSHLQPVSSPCLCLCCINSTFKWTMQLSFFFFLLFLTGMHFLTGLWALITVQQAFVTNLCSCTWICYTVVYRRLILWKSKKKVWTLGQEQQQRLHLNHCLIFCTILFA